jgi:WD40 repeat protein
VLDSGTGELLRTATFSAGPVSRVACKSHSDRPTFLTEDGVSGATDQSVPRLDSARDLSWSPCGRYLAILRAGSLSVWSAEEQKLVTLPAQMNGTELIAWNPNPDNGCVQLAATVAYGVFLWSAMGAAAIRVLPPAAETRALAWEPAGRYLALAYRNGDVQTWDYRTNQRLRLRCEEHPVHRLLWDRSSAILIGASITSLCAWNVKALINGRRGSSWEERQESPLTDLAFRGSGNIFATGNVEGRLELRRAGNRTGALPSKDFGSPITHLAWSVSGKRLAVGMDGGQICVVRVCK